ncbi:MAG: Rieske 2Fe-2S domain-containing protein [bacterium]|nr:Rieske 2Fe-2S domain-containing protein [bacterium]
MGAGNCPGAGGPDALAWHVVARLEDLATDGTGLSIPVAGRQIALFRTGAELHALDDSCPHRGGSLGLGVVLDGAVTCPWHGWHFDLDTGCNTDGLEERVRVRPVRTNAGGEVEVGLPV